MFVIKVCFPLSGGGLTIYLMLWDKREQQGWKWHHLCASTLQLSLLDASLHIRSLIIGGWMHNRSITIENYNYLRWVKTWIVDGCIIIFRVSLNQYWGRFYWAFVFQLSKFYKTLRNRGFDRRLCSAIWI